MLLLPLMVGSHRCPRGKVSHHLPPGEDAPCRKSETKERPVSTPPSVQGPLYPHRPADELADSSIVVGPSYEAARGGACPASGDLPAPLPAEGVGLALKYHIPKKVPAVTGSEEEASQGECRLGKEPVRHQKGDRPSTVFTRLGPYKDHAIKCPMVKDEVDRWTQTPAREEEDEDKGWLEQLELRAIRTTSRTTGIRRKLSRLEDEMAEIWRLARVERQRRRTRQQVSGQSLNK